jgi:hypothetical protein
MLKVFPLNKQKFIKNIIFKRKRQSIFILMSSAIVYMGLNIDIREKDQIIKKERRSLLKVKE